MLVKVEENASPSHTETPSSCFISNRMTVAFMLKSSSSLGKGPQDEEKRCWSTRTKPLCAFSSSPSHRRVKNIGKQKKKWKVRPKRRKSTSLSKARKKPSSTRQEMVRTKDVVEYYLYFEFFAFVISGKTRFILAAVWWCQAGNVSSYQEPSPSFLLQIFIAIYYWMLWLTWRCFRRMAHIFHCFAPLSLTFSSFEQTFPLVPQRDEIPKMEVCCRPRENGL